MTDPFKATPTREDENIAEELERVAELILHHPELNHQAAERLKAIAGDIRADAARANKSVPKHVEPR